MPFPLSIILYEPGSAGVPTTTNPRNLAGWVEDYTASGRAKMAIIWYNKTNVQMPRAGEAPPGPVTTFRGGLTWRVYSFPYGRANKNTAHTAISGNPYLISVKMPAVVTGFSPIVKNAV